jgi:hypothetical protein
LILDAAERNQGGRLPFCGTLRELLSAITEKRLELLHHVSANAGLNVRIHAGIHDAA